jgi:glycosyltransferase involved in cell wall biosynthesis
MAILFWFYKNPAVTEDRLSAILQMNAGVPIFGIYGGPQTDIEEFQPITSRLDDLWLHPEVSADWAWYNGDLMLARWYQERGRQLSWSSVFIHQWDLLLATPAEQFNISDQQEIVLPGVRPLEEVSSNWIWVQPWSHYYPAFQAFCSHPLVKGRNLLASVFILATLSRRFLADYSRTALEVPGLFEYRLPTVASILGYRFKACALYPDWGDRGDPLLNGCQRAVTREQILQSYREQATRVWHPVYESAPLNELTAPAPRAANIKARTRIAVLQVPPARPGIVAGGAQAVADALARGFKLADHEVLVFAGTNDAVPALWVNDGVRYRSAFRITHQLLQGEAGLEFFPGETALLRSCRVAFMFDRVFPVPDGVEAVLFLGATAYAFARSAALSRKWHFMIVPSEFVYEEIASLLTANGQRGRLERVKVVPNPIDLDALGLVGPATCRVRTDSHLRMLFPHRGDTGKGIDASLQLVDRLRSSFDVTLLVVVDASPTAEEGFYTSVMQTARSIGVLGQVGLTPWVPRAQMPSLYASADLTLCLGQVPEGFGLVCLESVLCGTPVLAREAGAQTHLLPRGHGCFVAVADDEGMARQVRDLVFTSSLPEQLRRGGDLIRKRFSTEAFIESVRAVTGL